MAVRRSASPSPPAAPRRRAAVDARTPSPFIAHCLELLAPLGAPRARRMFGGHGLYLDELFIAIVQDETLYLKVDALNQPQFAAAGSVPFRYSVRGELRDLSFWRTPDDAMESPALMAPWARLALEAALRKRAEAGRAPGEATVVTPARRPRVRRPG